MKTVGEKSISRQAGILLRQSGEININIFWNGTLNRTFRGRIRQSSLAAAVISGFMVLIYESSLQANNFFLERVELSCNF